MVFISPYRITILMLCQLYCDRSVTDVPIMRRVFDYLDSNYGPNTSDGVDIVVNSSFNVLAASLDLDRTKYEQVLELLLLKLWSIKCLDDLHSLFIHLDDYLQTSFNDREHFGNEQNRDLPSWICENRPVNGLYLSNQSVLGTFFRQCFLSFEDMEFEETSKLWQDFQIFREPSRPLYINICSDNVEFHHPDQVSELNQMETAFAHIINNSNNNRLPIVDTVDTCHIESVIKHQLDILNLNASNVSPNLMHAIQLFSNHVELIPSSAFLLEFYDACRSKDHDKAFENLHRYYDYTMENHGRSHYQYALFTLATIQAEFGGTSEAMRAIEEAISVARENKDYNCLTQILSWVSSFLKLHPDVQVPRSLDNKDQISQFLRAKSYETASSSNLLSGQSDTIDAMSTGKSIMEISENFVKTSYMNIVTNSPNMAVQTHLLQASLWSRCGVDVLAEFYLELAKDISTFTRGARCSETDALSEVSEFSLGRLSVQTAFLMLKLGKVSEAKLHIDSVKPNGKSVLYQQLWFPNFQLFQLELALQESKLHTAQILIEQLLNNPDNIQIAQETKLAEIRLEILQGNVSSAIQKVMVELDNAVVLNLDAIYQLQYMLLYARALGSTDYTRVFTLAFKVMEIARKKNLVPLHLEAILLVCRIFNFQSHFSDTASLLDLAMPKLLECGWVNLIGEAYELLSEATVGQTNILKDKNEKRILLEKALYYTSEACKYYKRGGNLKDLSYSLQKQKEVASNLNDLIVIDSAEKHLANVQHILCENYKQQYIY